MQEHAIDAAILCGGKNSRLEIQLAEVNGKPYLDWLVDRLRGFGFRRIILCAAPPTDQLQEWLSKRPSDGVDIEFSVEPFQQGTGLAIRHAREQLKTDPILVMNGDTISNADLGVFIDYHGQGSLTVLEGRRYPTINYRSAGHYLMSQAVLDEIVEKKPKSLEDFVHDHPSRKILRSGVYYDIASPGYLKHAEFFFENVLEVA